MLLARTGGGLASVSYQEIPKSLPAGDLTGRSHHLPLSEGVAGLTVHRSRAMNVAHHARQNEIPALENTLDSESGVFPGWAAGPGIGFLTW